jgi:S1-C subfamily serine protease
MVAHQYFDNRYEPAAPAAPPASPPPKRFRRGLLVVVAAVALASGAGSGAAAAALIAHGASASAATVATTTSTSTTTAPSSTATSIYQQDSPSVVTITDVISGPQGSGQAIGSGIVLDTNGDILTNAHVIAGARQIQVTFSNGQTVSATVVGSSTSADLAVLRVSVAASSLHPAVLGNSSSVQVGDTVYAIGSPFGLSGTLTEGIVSNINQSGSASGGSNLSGLIQTDAAINPGNSGGALVNAQGQVIGINNSIISPVDGNVGVGFAIPINQVKTLLTSLEGGLNV